MGDQSERQFPIVYSFDGAPSADGTALLVEATGFDGSVMRFAIPIDNVKHFIAFLLVWIGTISATRENGDDAEGAAAAPSRFPPPQSRSESPAARRDTSVSPSVAPSWSFPCRFRPSRQSGELC